MAESTAPALPIDRKNALADALRRITPRLLLVLGGGVLLLFVLGVAWLQIPDSHAWEFALSIVSAVVLTVAKLWLWGWVFTQLRRSQLRWYRTLWLFVFAAVGCLIWLPIAAGREREILYAGYWNSQLPASWRTFFTYERIIAWQDRFYDLAEWAAFAVLVPLAIETIACGFGAGSLRNAARVYRRWLFWVVTILAGWAAFSLTHALTVGWKLAPGLRREAISLVLRFGAAFAADLLPMVFVLALTAVYLERAAHAAPPPE